MKHTKYLSLVPALAVLAATPMLAQKGGRTTDDAQRPPEEFRLPTFVKAPIGARAIVSNQQQQRLGVVQDHVIDRLTGRVLYVAVGAAENVAAGKEPHAARLVSYDKFVWNAEEQRLVLPMTPEELAVLPEYDPENLPPIVRRTAERERGVSEIEDESVGREDRAGRAHEAAAKMQPSRLTSSSLLGCEILAEREPFAAVRELVLEPNAGTIAFVLARDENSKSDPFIVPWPAMAWRVANEEAGEEGHFTLPLGKEALEDAPTLKGGDTARLGDREALEGIYRFYKITPPVALHKQGASRG